jgi:beta-lactamase regulating signal transducer with metallopeptidase domain
LSSRDFFNPFFKPAISCLIRPLSYERETHSSSKIELLPSVAPATFASQATNTKSLSLQASSSSSSTQAPSGSGDHRLAPGVLAGIVIGVLAAFGFIVGVALWILKRHRVKTKHERNISPDGLELTILESNMAQKLSSVLTLKPPSCGPA